MLDKISFLGTLSTKICTIYKNYAIDSEQDACQGVHSACQGKNGHKAWQGRN